MNARTENVMLYCCEDNDNDNDSEMTMTIRGLLVIFHRTLPRQHQQDSNAHHGDGVFHAFQDAMQDTTSSACHLDDDDIDKNNGWVGGAVYEVVGCNLARGQRRKRQRRMANVPIMAAAKAVSNFTPREL